MITLGVLQVPGCWRCQLQCWRSPRQTINLWKAVDEICLPTFGTEQLIWSTSQARASHLHFLSCQETFCQWGHLPVTGQISGSMECSSWQHLLSAMVLIWFSLIVILQAQEEKMFSLSALMNIGAGRKGFGCLACRSETFVILKAKSKMKCQNILKI